MCQFRREVETQDAVPGVVRRGALHECEGRRSESGQVGLARRGRCGDQDPHAGVDDDVARLGVPVAGVHGHHDRTDRHRAEEHREQVHRRGEQESHAVRGPDTEPEQHPPDGPGALR